jgi:hypothetical protein
MDVVHQAAHKSHAVDHTLSEVCRITMGKFLVVLILLVCLVALSAGKSYFPFVKNKDLISFYIFFIK